MNFRVGKACGIDVHKFFLIATILNALGYKETRKFGTCLEGLLALRDWIVDSGCQRVALESTGVYWIPIYACLEGRVEIVLANPRQIKNIPGRKTDVLDSEWIAELCLNGQIKPSFVPSREVRELSDLTRTRTKMIQTRTAFKNRVHKVLQRTNIRISGVLKDIFGKAGVQILNGLISGKTVDEVLRDVKRIGKKKAAIKEAIQGELGEAEIFVIRECLGTIAFLDGEISKLDSMVSKLLEEEGRHGQMEVLMSIPGLAFTSASAILAEVGDVDVFPHPKNLVGWSGLAPSVSESAGKSSNGLITMKGSKYLRRMLVQCANVIADGRPNKLRFFYQRILVRKGRKIAIVALARKLLSIIHHLLKNNEKYSEDEIKLKQVKLLKSQPISKIDWDEIVEIISKAGYHLRQNHTFWITSYLDKTPSWI